MEAAKPRPLLDLDDLLEEICLVLQLTPTLYENARTKYEAIAAWLAAPGSNLLPYAPLIFPQGSFRIQTTVRPWRYDEYDLDLVCRLAIPLGLQVDPMWVYGLVEERLAANETYRTRLERYKRCLRIVYAGRFHLDITPARPDPSGVANHLVVPDRKLKAWKPSDPRGFATWFNMRTLAGRRLALVKAAEPLPEKEPAHGKPPLKRTVQLMKRHRDIVFRGADDAPRSIVLSTLAARHYAGEESIADALENVLVGIQRTLAACEPPLRVLNPTNPKENFADSWEGNPKEYYDFVDYIDRFLESVRALRAGRGLDVITSSMGKIFGDKVATNAVERSIASVGKAREEGRLRATGRSAGIITGVGEVAVTRNTFFGD